MRNRFDIKLNDLKNDIVMMGTLIEQAISKSIIALREQNIQLAREVIANDDAVDDLERTIERKSLRILLTEQPVAKDLRDISTALKMITDMERICDHAVDIAEIALNFKGKSNIIMPGSIVPMAHKAIAMVSRSIDAFVTQDLALANSVIGMDDEVDHLFLVVRDEIVGCILADKNSAEQAIDFMMIAKYLERVGDHAQNVAEWVIFNITGEHKNERIL